MEVNCRLRRGLKARQPKTCAAGEICGFNAFGRFEALSRDMVHTITRSLRVYTNARCSLSADR